MTFFTRQTSAKCTNSLTLTSLTCRYSLSTTEEGNPYLVWDLGCEVVKGKCRDQTEYTVTGGIRDGIWHLRRTEDWWFSNRSQALEAITRSPPVSSLARLPRAISRADLGSPAMLRGKVERTTVFGGTPKRVGWHSRCAPT